MTFSAIFEQGLSPQRRWEHARQTISALCFTACPRTGVLQSSDGTFCNFTRGLSPERRWDNAPCVCAVKPNRALSAKGRLRSCRPESPHNMTVLLRRTPKQTTSRHHTDTSSSTAGVQSGDEVIVSRYSRKDHVSSRQRPEKPYLSSAGGNERRKERAQTLAGRCPQQLQRETRGYMHI